MHPDVVFDKGAALIAWSLACIAYVCVAGKSSFILDVSSNV